MTFEEIFDEQARTSKMLITEGAISRIAVPKLKEFDENEKDLIKKLHKELLAIAKDKNKSDEVGFLVDLVDWTYQIIFGVERGISIRSNPEAKEKLLTSPSRSLLFLHNHPRNKVFSERDLNSFLTSDAILMVTVVCNNGRTYYLVKNVDYSSDKALRYYDDIFEDSTIENNVKEFLRTCNKVGLSFYYGGY